MKKTCLFICVCLFLCFSVYAGDKVVIHAAKLINKLPDISPGLPSIKARHFQLLTIDIDYLNSQLSEHLFLSKNPSEIWLELPTNKGESILFLLSKNTTMSKKLAKKFPEIKTFDGYSSQGAIAKFDLTAKGFHGMIRNPNASTVYIDPYHSGDNKYYQMYQEQYVVTDKPLHCQLKTPSITKSISIKDNRPSKPVIPYTNCALKKYRLALAATYQYTQLAGGSISDALASEVTTVNRMNGIYEADAGVTFELIDNNDSIICTYPGCPTSPPYPSGVVPYTSGQTSALINENQINIDIIIGSAHYDVGHVIDYNTTSFESDGLARLASVCDDSIKAMGATSGAQPISDPFTVDFLSHELGHQFDATHTQSNTCNANAPTAVEPGSGSTILAYAGICPPNVQNNSGAYFHGISLQQMGAFTQNTATCSKNKPISSAPTIVSSNGNSTVPISTPFALNVVATAATPGAVLSYDWEEIDAALSTQPPKSTATTGSNFRSFDPSVDPIRYFPSLFNLNSSAASGVMPTWEVLSSVPRVLNFRVTVRNNTVGGSCNAYKDYTVNVVNESSGQAFSVNTPANQNILWPSGSQQTISWNVAGTNTGSVNAPTVNILLSIDGGLTYPYILANGVANNGSAVVTLPAVTTTTSRIMIIASTKTFFNISPYDFTIASPLLTKATRNPLKTTTAFIYFTGIPETWYSSTFKIPQFPNANVVVDGANQRFIVSNLNIPGKINVSIDIATGKQFTTTNKITVPGIA